ncbi:phosphonate metabolism protein PhnM [Gracilibacillus halophilus YIM-C55.5]|uniref:Phosphonate metabolism protein PhnM n=1 Tax=Gracilibacillus halophilus YIM-C55.5 TaxID=1308866 RepID=N4WM74_9BACI|nr:phosphonate metabolism protein PhnM [Gracilibacillus halophilus]ENH95595.1 phosphonate metabolism protein PhnM [Gracilibacillus halophilus YIM-C55.5]
MKNKKTIYNANIVTPTEVIRQGSLQLEGDRILKIYEGNPVKKEESDLDAAGDWLIPGFIDSHCDAIEIELEPRPNSRMPIEISFYELEKKLVGQGITTIYHSLSLLEDRASQWIRRTDHALEMIQAIHEFAQKTHLIRHKIHLRYEINNIAALDMVKQLIRDRSIDQLSFMDHSPGQGQFRDLEVYKRYLIEHRHHTVGTADELIQKSKQFQKLDGKALKELAHLASIHNIPIASHDDDSIEKLEVIQDWNASISEFPIRLDVAKHAKKIGLDVVMGAPNALLGKSHSNNLSAMEAVRHNVVDIFCSDYYPSSLLHTTFKLFQEGMPLHEAVNKVTHNPAHALGLSNQIGSIEVGNEADFLLIREDNDRPMIEKVFVKGKVICEMNYQFT